MLDKELVQDYSGHILQINPDAGVDLAASFFLQGIVPKGFNLPPQDYCQVLIQPYKTTYSPGDGTNRQSSGGTRPLLIPLFNRTHSIKYRDVLGAVKAWEALKKAGNEEGANNILRKVAEYDFGSRRNSIDTNGTPVARAGRVACYELMTVNFRGKDHQMEVKEGYWPITGWGTDGKPTFLEATRRSMDPATVGQPVKEKVAMFSQRIFIFEDESIMQAEQRAKARLYLVPKQTSVTTSSDETDQGEGIVAGEGTPNITDPIKKSGEGEGEPKQDTG